KHVLGRIWTPDRAFAIEKFAELCHLARPFGLSISLEPVSFAEVRTLADAASVIRAAKADNGAICVDTLHFARAGDKVEDIAALPPALFPFLQLCDAKLDL